MPSRGSARGCSGSPASRRSSNEREENDEQQGEEGKAGIGKLLGRGESRDEGARPRAEGCRGRGKRCTGRAGRDVAQGSRARQTVSRDRHRERPRTQAEDVVRDAGVCEGRQGRLLLPQRREVQGALRDVRFQRQREAGRGLDVADRIRAHGADRSRRSKDPQAREEGGELTMSETTVTPPHELEIRVERVFDAPRAHVFSVWTDPQLIPEWWGDGTVVEEMDVRPGGTYRFRTAFGVVEGEFREVDAPERLVQTFQNHLQTLEFEDLGGRTKLTQTMRFASTEERDT